MRVDVPYVLQAVGHGEFGRWARLAVIYPRIPSEFVHRGLWGGRVFVLEVVGSRKPTAGSGVLTCVFFGVENGERKMVTPMTRTHLINASGRRSLAPNCRPTDPNKLREMTRASGRRRLSRIGVSRRVRCSARRLGPAEHPFGQSAIWLI
jgi:hypothetical protein